MSLTETMMKEFDSDVVNDSKAVLTFDEIWSKETKGISEKKRDEYTEIIYGMEFSFFEQGFIRGIAAAKSGTV